MEAMKAIASMPHGHCLGALEMLYSRNLKFPSRVPFTREKWLGALTLSRNEAYRPGPYTITQEKGDLKNEFQYHCPF